MEYLVVDSALGTGWLAGKSNERPIAVLDDFLSAAELQPLLAQRHRCVDRRAKVVE